jgi:putative two-component system response regulator
VNGEDLASILVVDDDDADRRLLADILVREGYATVVAQSVNQARDLLGAQSFALVVCDLNLHGESAVGLVAHIGAAHPDTAVLVVSGGTDRNVAAQLLELGAYAYLVKPFGIDQFLITVTKSLRLRTLEHERLQYERSLEQAVRDRTMELRRSRQETVQRLAAALDRRDGVTGVHSERTAHYSYGIAKALVLPELTCELLALATPLHDIGKVAIPDDILHKAGPLTAAERETMETHAEIGHELLAGSGEDLLELAATIAWTHHERLDGSGYPRGLVGDQIPLAGRIAAAADVLDALTSDRPYRPACPLEHAVEILLQQSGTQLDPDIVDALLGSIGAERSGALAGVAV